MDGHRLVRPAPDLAPVAQRPERRQQLRRPRLHDGHLRATDGADSSATAIIYAGVFAVSTIISSFYRFSEERLRLLWRGWLTRLLIDLYMSRDRFYRLKARDEVNNPDERITEDVKSYTQTTLSFFLMSLNALITSLAFLGVLWSITP